MELERIRNEKHPMYQKALDLYKISFPEHEQREAFSQRAILTNEDYHFDIVTDVGVFVGEVLYWEVQGFYYIEHFCIHPEMRNKQYGQRTLELLDKPLILEIDPPIDDISIRRKGFYERCGLVENPYHHVHPPYHKENQGHELVIMSMKRILTSEECKTFQDYLQNVVMRDVYHG